MLKTLVKERWVGSLRRPYNHLFLYLAAPPLPIEFRLYSLLLQF